MLINKEMKMADVIHLNHHLLPIINRFGIQLGFGERSVHEVCKDYAVNLDFFLEIVNTFHDPSYFPLRHLRSFAPGMLIDYLQKTHLYYLRIKLPEIAQYIRQLTSNTDVDPNHVLLLQDFFKSYESELTAHINREEQRVYPYIRTLEKALQTGAVKADCAASEAYTIHHYEEEHDDVESKLFDLKNIIIKYLPSPVESRLFNIILHELFELEKDLNNHAHIEDLILVPMVEKMEKELIKAKSIQ